jgi:hypothetical protein
LVETNLMKEVELVGAVWIWGSAIAVKVAIAAELSKARVEPWERRRMFIATPGT